MDVRERPCGRTEYPVPPSSRRRAPQSDFTNSEISACIANLECLEGFLNRAIRCSDDNLVVDLELDLARRMAGPHQPVECPVVDFQRFVVSRDNRRAAAGEPPDLEGGRSARCVGDPVALALLASREHEKFNLALLADRAKVEFESEVVRNGRV